MITVSVLRMVTMWLYENPIIYLNDLQRAGPLNVSRLYAVGACGTDLNAWGIGVSFLFY